MAALRAVRHRSAARSSSWDGSLRRHDRASCPHDDELRERLTPEQYEVTQKGGTERAFTGAYWNTKDPGTYRCIVCDTELFRSDTKYDSGSGWPSFTEPMAADARPPDHRLEPRHDPHRGPLRHAATPTSATSSPTAPVPPASATA